MKKWLQKLSNIQELVLVLTLAFAWFILKSNYLLIKTFIDSKITIKQDTFRFTIVLAIEIAALIIIFYILTVRKQKLSSFNLQFGFKDVLIGIALFIPTYLVYYFSSNLLYYLFSSLPVPSYHLSATFFSIILLVIINSFYEEFFLNSYLFQRLAHWNVGWVLVLSVLIRAGYHTYQGLVATLVIIILGLILSGYFSKYRKLWPIVIVHLLTKVVTMLL